MNNLNIKDPVCGMNVSETSKFSTTNDKKEYYFCSQNCLNKFERNPSQYLNEEKNHEHLEHNHLDEPHAHEIIKQNIKLKKQTMAWTILFSQIEIFLWKKEILAF